MRVYLLLCLLLLSLPAVAQEILQLTFEVEGTDLDEKAPLTVLLGGDWLEYGDRDNRLRHDFAHKKTYVISGDTANEYPLYAEVGFRAAEIRNRLAINDAMATAKVDTGDVPADPVLLEHFFALELADAKSPQEVTEDGLIKFSFEDKPLMEFTRETALDLTPDKQKELARFYRYYIGGHPDALARIAEGPGVPKSLSITQYQVGGVVSRTFRLKSSRPLTEEPLVPAEPGYGDDPLGLLVQRARDLTVPEIAAAHRQVEQDALNALDDRNYIRAALKFLEARLDTGGELAPEFQAEKATIMKDPDVARLFQALTPEGEEQLEASLAVLSEMAQKYPDSAPVLTLFKGSLLLGQNKAAKARPLILEALRARPVISSGWKDLGETYYNEYEFRNAWQCWEVGRGLAPENAHFNQVRALEMLLEASYPEFF